MTRAEAEKRIREACPWAEEVRGLEPYSADAYLILARAGDGNTAVTAQSFGNTLEAAVSRLEDVLKGGKPHE